MSKKQRDSLYAEVQKHQKSQSECLGSSAVMPGSLGSREDSVEDGGLSRSYSSGGSSTTTLSDLDDIAALPDMLFDLPLTPEEASEYCSGLEMLGGGGGGGGGMGGGSSASSGSSNQSSPEPSSMDSGDGGSPPIKHEYQMLAETAVLTHSPLGALPDDCSLLDIGECESGCDGWVEGCWLKRDCLSKMD